MVLIRIGGPLSLCFALCLFGGLESKKLDLNRTRYKTITPPNKKTLSSVATYGAKDPSIVYYFRVNRSENGEEVEKQKQIEGFFRL